MPASSPIASTTSADDSLHGGHRAGGLLGGADAPVGDLARLLGGAGRLGGQVARRLHHPHLPLGALGDVLDGPGDLVDGAARSRSTSRSAPRDAALRSVGGRRHLGDDAAQRLDHLGDGGAQHVVVGLGLDGHGEVALRRRG